MKVLYVCRANVGRSQMAEAFHKKFYPEDIVSSAGTHVNENEGKTIGSHEKARYVWEVMDEEGINVRNYKRNQLTPQMVEEADKVVVITEKENCPDYLKDSSKAIYWNIGDAKGTDYDFHIKTRNKIKSKIEELLK